MPKKSNYFTGDIRGDGTKKGGLVLEASSPEGAIVVELTSDQDGYACYRVTAMPVKGVGPRPRPLIGGKFKDT